MSVTARLLVMLLCNTVIALAAARLAQAAGLPHNASFVTGLFATIPFLIWSATRVRRRIEHPLIALHDGLRALRDGDFSMRLSAPGAGTVAEMKKLYNEVADALRTQRNDVYQKELLLETILQRTPVAVVLVSAADRIVYSNSAAREVLADGRRLDGHRFTEIVEQLAAPVREAVQTGTDSILTVQSAGRDETFHLSQRTFQLNTVEHRLVLVERLTAELRRQEIAVWKNAIRMINHELNNTIAPISSMIHSARIAQERPDRHHHLPEIYGTIEERLGFLTMFLESYAQFARLPVPRKERTQWRDVLTDVRALYEFRMECDPAEAAMIDRAQMQQVLINLVKNAHESGSDPSQVVVSVQRSIDGSVLRVVDRGPGMTDEVMRQALVPFYTTKPAGSGLGLALCNEIVEAHGGQMRLQRREGGGTVVSCWVP